MYQLTYNGRTVKDAISGKPFALSSMEIAKDWMASKKSDLMDRGKTGILKIQEFRGDINKAIII